MSKYEVGDEADLGPILMARFISEIVAQGGKVSLKGNKAKVIYMPTVVKSKAKTTRKRV